MPDDRNCAVLAAQLDDLHVLRFVGAIRYPIAPAVSEYVDGVFSHTAEPIFVIDLTETISIDSTNLGTIARIALRADERHLRRVTILSSREDIDTVLVSMGFDEVFDIIAPAETPQQEAQPLRPGTLDEATLRATTLEAHRTLMQMNERNYLQFRDVVAMLEGEAGEAPGHGAHGGHPS